MANTAHKKITVGLILGWVFGIIFLVSGISTLFSQPLPGLFFLGAAAVSLPPVYHFLAEKTKMQLSGGVKLIGIIVLLAGATATMDKSKIATTNAGTNSPESVEEDIAEPATPKTYQEIFTFKGNGTKKSEPFTVEGEKFKVVYDCTGGYCGAWLKSPGSDFPVELLMNGTGPLKDESIIYKSGTYYIDANTIGSFTISVQDYR